MRTALPAPAFLARARRLPRENPTSFADTFMSATRKLGLDCGEALNQAAACQPRARRLYETKPEYRADLRARWRRALADVVRARKDPNAFAEYILRGAKPSKRSAWQRELAKAQPNRVVLAPVGAGMSGQLPWPALTRWLGPAKAFALQAAQERGERVAVLSHKPTGKLVGVPLERLVLDDLGPPGTWNQQPLGDRLLEHFRDAPPDPEAQAFINAHAVDDIAPPTMEQRFAAVSDGIWRDTIQRVADERGWNTGPKKTPAGDV